MKRILKMILFSILGIIGLIAITGFLFVNLSPQFGASKKEKLTEMVTSSKNHNDGVFHNQEETAVMMDFKFSSLKEYFNSKGKEPELPLPSNTISTEAFQVKNDTLASFTWFGHSAILLELEGKKVFIDPMLGNTSGPHSMLGPSRFDYQLPITADSIPYLDLVLISHDHYDHLDLESIRKLKDKTKLFIVPLGVGAHLKKWKVPESKIMELDWWDSTDFEGIKIISTPARHFSGRGLNDRNTTLWSSFVLETRKNKVYFSGDGGYGKHFKEIGDKYGPFDLCFLECGQYNEQWAQIHMMPEEVILANNDLQGKVILPIHWGAFKLALHTWTDPVERLMAKKDETQARIITPIIGEKVEVSEPKSYEFWWKGY